MRDILAYANNYRTITPSMRYAAELAKMFPSSLSGLYVQEPITLAPSIEAVQLAAEIYKFTEEQVQAAREMRATFKAWASGLGISENEWMIVEGALTRVLPQAANWHDLLVLGIGGEAEWESVGKVGEVLLTCSSPCVVVPAAHTTATTCKNIAIAWNGSSESVRALHAALPLLKRAERVTVIHGVVDFPFLPDAWIPPIDLEAYLARHGVAIERRAIDVSEDKAGDALLAVAAEIRADLLVMGAYGKTRLSEWFFGGATRHVLENSRIPLFMRH